MIRLENASKVYEAYTAVQEVSFEVKQGERFVLLGSSGSGKTTTLKMINRLIPYDAGSIYVDGKEIRTLEPVAMRRKIGYVMQHAGLFPHLSILENVSLVPKLLKWPTAKITKRAEELMEVFGLPFQRFHGLKPQQLSGGQQQRIGIVRALMADPPIILMDEPFGALDPLSRTALRKEFSRLKELQGKTIILVTHDIQEALELGHRIGIMDKGKLLQVDKPVKFIFNPASDYVKQFFSGQLYSSSLKEMRLTELAKFLDKSHLRHSSQNDLIITIDRDTSISNILDQMVSAKAYNITLIMSFNGKEETFFINEEQILISYLKWKQQYYNP